MTEIGNVHVFDKCRITQSVRCSIYFRFLFVYHNVVYCCAFAVILCLVENYTVENVQNVLRFFSPAKYLLDWPFMMTFLTWSSLFNCCFCLFVNSSQFFPFCSVVQPYRTTPLVLPGAKVKKDYPTESYLRHHPNPMFRQAPPHPLLPHELAMKQRVRVFSEGCVQ